jgi:PKD repeat protein
MGWAVTESCSSSPNSITGLTAVNDGPTELGSETQLTATVMSGSDVQYGWDFGDGGSGSGAVIKHEYTATGTYTATITATNTVSSDTAITLVEIIPPNIPIIGLIAENDSPTTLGETTYLTATVMSGSHVQYDWDFGDGGSGIGALVAHVYPATGIYTATVSVENAANQAVAATVVEIVLPPGKIYIPLVIKR